MGSTYCEVTRSSLLLQYCPKAPVPRLNTRQPFPAHGRVPRQPDDATCVPLGSHPRRTESD